MTGRDDSRGGFGPAKAPGGGDDGGFDDDDLPGPGQKALRGGSIAPSPPPQTVALKATPRGPRRTAFVLSGGGARGAYEVGVLSYIFTELPRLRRGRMPRVDIVCGTSVGAINACYLAAHASQPENGIRQLVDVWHDLEIGHVLGFGVRQAASLPRLVFGGGAVAAGLFDVRPMADMIEKQIGWRDIARNLRRGYLRALSVSTTEVSTGRTVIFMQTSPETALPTQAPPRTLIRAEHIGPPHALASAAIPLLFPPVQIGGEFYCDGGLRLNTPMAPALRLGATHVFAVALSREVKGLATAETGPGHVRPMSAAALLGKVLNAFLLDHVVNDLDVLARINQLITDGVRAYGDGFLEGVSQAARVRGGEVYRPVHCLALRPSEDIGRMAAQHVTHGRFRGGSLVAKQLLKLLYVGGDTDADLASYILFDGGFARKLIDLGRADAAARRDEILAFFADDDAESKPPSEPPSGRDSDPRYSVAPKIVG